MRAVLHTLDGKVYVGQNDIAEPVTECPRKGMKSGEGYHLCRSVCRQSAHAEVNALKAALLDGVSTFEGSTLYLYGHTHCCMSCQKVMYEFGVESYFIDNEQYFLEQNKLT